jgi:nicotinate-nucleotide pyrophosphorylase (carboxylating)
MFPDAATLLLLRAALDEDIGAGDITTRLVVPPSTQARLAMRAREGIVMCGDWVVPTLLTMLQPESACRVEPQAADGEAVAAGGTLLTLSGDAHTLLTLERTALNILQRLCGVASLTRRYVEAVAGTGVTILDTRKTLPGWRTLDKYATRTGGAVNHRMRLDDAILIKDNHLALAGCTLAEAVARARNQGSGVRGQGMSLIVECDTLAQTEEALTAGVDRILLDNMPLAMLREAVALRNRLAPSVQLEASGGVSLETVRAIAETGVECISVGRLTHSAPAVDIGLDVEGDS